MSKETPLDFAELVGELREMRDRVIAFEIRDDESVEIARGEGALGNLETSEGRVSFDLGAIKPPEGFIAASSIRFELPEDRIADVYDTATGIGPTMHLRIRLTRGTQITIWPAMPPQEQWTDLHEENR